MTAPLDTTGLAVWLHRFTIKPHHEASYWPCWEEEKALLRAHGFDVVAAYVETDAEPKLTQLLTHPGPTADEAWRAVRSDPRTAAVNAAKAPHVFRNATLRRVEPHLLTRPSEASVAGRIAIMRRYAIVGDWDEFLALWQHVAQVRQRYDFRCLFAVADREQNMFTWAFDFTGTWADFPAAQRDYYHDPERVALRGVFDYMADYALHPARQLLT